jgi:hypothetical protein
MGPQPNDSSCTQCHPASGSMLAVTEAHRHPLNDTALNSGLKFDLQQVSEAGTNNGNGKLDPGEKVQISFTMKDDIGLNVDPGDLARMEVAISGPTTNRNLVLFGRFPTSKLTSSTVTTLLPDVVFLERLGVSTAANNDSFPSAGNHWNLTDAPTSVRVRTATAGGDTTLSAAAAALQNYIDVADVTNFATGDYIVIDDTVAGFEEYLQVRLVDGSRLWFASAYSPPNQPFLRFAHAANATVKEVTLTTKTVTTDYTVTAATGVITEVADAFGSGNVVLVSYTTDFVMPAVYQGSINDSPDLDETWGKWKGKTLESGTYTVGIWGELTLSLVLHGETNTYPVVSKPATKDVLVGSATTLKPQAIISSGANCNACHNDLWFHGSHRRSFETCVLCHGTAGAEDRPRYASANGPATPGEPIDYRRMLHRIHHGAELAKASTWTVVGFGGTPHTYEHVEFPDFKGGTKNCVTCHGATNNAWKAPAARDHSTQQTKPTRVWMVACGSCHDSDETLTHIDLQTTQGGVESCAVCHGPGRDEDVTVVHKVR